MSQEVVYQITWMLLALHYMSVQEKLCLIYDFTQDSFFLHIFRDTFSTLFQSKTFKKYETMILMKHLQMYFDVRKMMQTSYIESKSMEEKNYCEQFT